MAQYRITQDARADIVDILWHAQVQFGPAARRQYQGLILATLDAIANQQDRNGSYERTKYIDYRAMARDMEYSGDVFTLETGFEQVHVFWNR